MNEQPNEQPKEESKQSEPEGYAPRPSSFRALIAWFFVLSFKDKEDKLTESLWKDSERSVFEKRLRQLIWWPPDIFAATSSVLNSTGSYRFIVGPNGAFGKHLWQRLDWQARIEANAEAWRSSISKKILTAFPKECASSDQDLKEAIEEVVAERSKRRFLEPLNLNEIDPDLYPLSGENYLTYDLINFFINEIVNLNDDDGYFADQNLLAVSVKAEKFKRKIKGSTENEILSVTQAARFIEAIIGLHILADAASFSIGVPRSSTRESAVFDAIANIMLTLRGSLSTVSKFHGVVLPKMRTPQSGLTLRNLSHNLTFHDCEVEVMWRSFPWSNFDENTLNILYVPYPFDFKPSRFNGETNTFESVGYFTYDPGKWDQIGSVVDLVEDVTKKGADPHMIVFTETAFNEETYKALITALSQNYGETQPQKMPVILAGVAREQDGSTYNELWLSTYFAGKWYKLTQQKHHRWQLNESQIKQYGLQGRLSTSRPLFEKSIVDQRRLTFYAPTPWLVVSPLICEDLSRIEPVSELIRGVGPTLVLALLLDGPQLEKRWPGRYASVLADDPGSGVLTMTSYGIANTSRPVDRNLSEENKKSENNNQNSTEKTEDNSVIVASWKDSKSQFQAISVKKDEAVLLTLTATIGEEFTLDGRGIRNKAAGFKLDGTVTFKIPQTNRKFEINENLQKSNWSDIREVTAITYVASAALSLLRPHLSKHPVKDSRDKQTDTWTKTPYWGSRYESVTRLIDVMVGQCVLSKSKDWKKKVDNEINKNKIESVNKGKSSSNYQHFKSLKASRNVLLKHLFPSEQGDKNAPGFSVFNRHLFSVLIFSQSAIDVEVRDENAEWPTNALKFGAKVLRVLFDAIAGFETTKDHNGALTQESIKKAKAVYRRRLMIASLANRNKDIRLTVNDMDKTKRDVAGSPACLYSYSELYPPKYLNQFSPTETENPAESSLEFNNFERISSPGPNRYDYYRMILELIEAILNEMDPAPSLWRHCQQNLVGELDEIEMKRITLLILMVLPSLIHEQIESDFVTKKNQKELGYNFEVMSKLLDKSEKIILEASKATIYVWSPQ